MFKRMSVLVRRPDHDRATFSKLWERHAAPVSGLPKVRGYIQNHIEQDFSAAPPIQADGFVELLWDAPGDMAAAFASDAAKPMVEDEPGFLGHGSGYALAGAAPLAEALGAKLVVVVVGEEDIEAAAAELPGLTGLLRDEVTTLIPKPGMAPPQLVDAFVHLWFADVASAQAAGTTLAAAHPRQGIFRVRTIQFV